MCYGSWFERTRATTFTGATVATSRWSPTCRKRAKGALRSVPRMLPVRQRQRGDQCGHELCPDHDIQTCGSCHERWCDNCRTKKMVECSHVTEEDPHVVCETCAQTCAGCSVTICRQCADICEFCDDYKNANVYCRACRSQHGA